MNCLKHVLVMFLFYAATPSFAFGDPLCWLRTKSPQDQEIQGPIALNDEWQSFKLTKPFRAAPSLQYVQLLLSRSEYDFVELTDSRKHPESWNRWVPRHIHTGEILLFDVAVHNNKVGWIDLEYTFTGSPTLNDQVVAAIGFSANSEKKPRFYPSGSVNDEMRIRASHPVNLRAIWWAAPSYWKWPCRTWSEIPQSEILVP